MVWITGRVQYPASLTVDIRLSSVLTWADPDYFACIGLYLVSQ